MGPQEGGVADVLLEALFRTDVEAVAFDIDPEEVAIGVHLGQADGIFALAAGQFEGEGVVIFEKGGPAACHPFRVLEDIGKGFQRFEPDEFLLAHGGKNTICIYKSIFPGGPAGDDL